MSDIKPIGFKPDGSHVNKGAVLIILFILMGAYCTFSDAPFGTPKVDHKMTLTVVEK
jgi:hypothetical protein